MSESPNPKYLITLAAVAAVTLAGGALLKPKKGLAEPLSKVEAASLRAAVRRQELGETASYFAQRAESFGRHVINDRGRESSAVAWERRGRVISASGPDSEALEPPLRLTPGDAGDPAPARRSDPEPGKWLLVVGRAEDGQLIWAPTVFGGIRRAICSGEAYRELIVNNRLGAALSGAGAFDLDGMMVGVVATCGGTERIISAADVPRLLAAFDTPARRTRRDYGLSVEELTDGVAQGFPADTGLLVTEIHVGGMADGAGLRAGDIITGAKDQAFSKPEDLFGALRSEDGALRVLQLIRGGRKITVAMPAVMEARNAKSADASFGIRMVAAKDGTQTVVTAVGTPAYMAGLRTGDKLIQAGGKEVTAKTLPQAVAAANDKPLLVVYERNGMQRVALVKR